VDWNKVADDLRNPGTLSYQVFKKLSKMIGVRKSFKAFGRGDMEWIDIKDANGNVIPEVMAYARVYDHDHFVIIQNLSDKDIFIPEDAFKICAGKEDRLGQPCPESTNDGITLKPYSYYWI